jgi:hypothetical protein
MKLFNLIKSLLYFLMFKYQKSKIHIYEASLIGKGSLVDIRYWFSRPDKVNPNGNIYLINDETGDKIYLMRISRFGVMRTLHNKFKTTGILLFYNRNGLVKQGSKVSIYFGKLTATNVEVK